MTASAGPGPVLPFEDFERCFKLSLALTPQQKRDVYRVRYRVYCEKYGFENAGAFRSGLESDRFDSESLHCLVTHKASGAPVGCVRLVLADSDRILPVEEHCGDALDASLMRRLIQRRGHLAEISRLAVDSPFSRRGEPSGRGLRPGPLAGDFGVAERRAVPMIAVALFLAAGALGDLTRRTDCFALMEPRLRALLRRSGICARRAGDELNYRGVRAPHYLEIDDAVRSLPDELRMAYDRIRAMLEGQLLPVRRNESTSAGEPANDVFGSVAALLRA